jgi:pseudomonalisin
MTPGCTLRSANGKFWLVMQPDGNLVLYNQAEEPLWASGTNGHPGATAVLQGDQHFVVYDSSCKFLWSTNVHHKSSKTVLCFLQDDGNFVQYDSARSVMWATATGGGKQGDLHGEVHRCM